MGFQFGLRKTLPLSRDKIWDFLFSERGLGIWLGRLTTGFEIKKPYETEDGIRGFVRVLNPNSHIRINWRKKEWENISTLQIRVISQKENKATLAIHQEKLLDPEQRAEMKEHWDTIMTKLSQELNRFSS
ncbi:MAG: SRPBCC domain-containing protein [Bacteroidota bacterium]